MNRIAAPIPLRAGLMIICGGVRIGRDASPGGAVIGTSRKKPPNSLSFPHPQSREKNGWKIKVTKEWKIRASFVRRAINVSEQRQTKDDVRPAKNRTSGGVFHKGFVLDKLIKANSEFLPEIIAVTGFKIQ
jgi:hypothetical protein